MPTAKVLVIDDDQDFRASLRCLLEAHGCEVVEAGSGHEGLHRLIEQKPDLIVLDVMMECCSEGYSVNQQIKFTDNFAEFRGIPIIMCSSIEQSPDELFPMAGEVEMIRPDYYLTKPLDIPRFLRVLERVLARKARSANA